MLPFLSVSCFEDRDDVEGYASTQDIKNFIWNGMNTFYLYKEDVPDLFDDRFTSQNELQQFLEAYPSPADLFYNLTAPQDEFSFLVNDYIALELALNNIGMYNGIQAGFARYPNNPSLLYGYVRYVLPNTSAETQGVTRGMIFSSIDGIQITETNYQELTSTETYTIGLAAFNNDEIIPTGENILLNKSEYAANPIYRTNIIELENEKVGYLMYNNFVASYDPQLNSVFAAFQAEGITELVIDLRYNGGGSVETCKDLASMITGQFHGEIFTTEQWNPQTQALLEAENPERLTNRFDGEIRSGAAINSLNLNRVYVLTTRSSASASELLMSGLFPYIDVVQIGTTTRGKFQASTTLYDSPNFQRSGATTGHRYAMQPLVLKEVNAAGFTDYINGLDPDIFKPENILNLGILGDPQEPLLNAAINHILGNEIPDRNANPIEVLGETDVKNPLFQQMYVQPLKMETLPNF